MQGGRGRLIKCFFHALTFKWLGDIESVRALHHMLGAGYLAPSYGAVMLASALAGRGAAGIYEKLGFVLMGKRFENYC